MTAAHVSHLWKDMKTSNVEEGTGAKEHGQARGLKRIKLEIVR